MTYFTLMNKTLFGMAYKTFYDLSKPRALNTKFVTTQGRP